MEKNERKREDGIEIAKKKCTLSDNSNTYDPFGEVIFFAAGSFFKLSVFLAPAFAFGCGFFLSPAFTFGCGLLREPSSSSLSQSPGIALPFAVDLLGDTTRF